MNVAEQAPVPIHVVERGIDLELDTTACACEAGELARRGARVALLSCLWGVDLDESHVRSSAEDEGVAIDDALHRCRHA